MRGLLLLVVVLRTGILSRQKPFTLLVVVWAHSVTTSPAFLWLFVEFARHNERNQRKYLSAAPTSTTPVPGDSSSQRQVTMVILAPVFALKDGVIHPVGMMEGRYEETLNLAVMPLDQIMPALRLDSVPLTPQT
ncbi:hypothetical protein NQ030_05845 [Corynebacterium phoceense]|nr:hypothetical protein [Corynebacterium phoceense]